VAEMVRVVKMSDAIVRDANRRKDDLNHA
jgi:hypothetical protein